MQQKQISTSLTSNFTHKEHHLFYEFLIYGGFVFMQARQASLVREKVQGWLNPKARELFFPLSTKPPLNRISVIIDSAFNFVYIYKLWLKLYRKHLSGFIILMHNI